MVAVAEALDLRCAALEVTVPGRRLIAALLLRLSRGRMLAVLGRNGAGKTSLLHVLAGLRAADGGAVELAGRPLDSWPRRALARQLGLLPQGFDEPFPGTVLEAALIGRHPHIEFWRWEGSDDVAIATRALAAVGLEALAQRTLASLSGGERRRLAIATLLAQDPQSFLLDEPLHQLDPHHQVEVLRLFRALADRGRSVMLTLHDAGLATRYADDALLLFGDGRWRCGPVDEVLTAASIGELYGLPMRELRYDGQRTFVPD